MVVVGDGTGGQDGEASGREEAEEGLRDKNFVGHASGDVAFSLPWKLVCIAY